MAAFIVGVLVVTNVFRIVQRRSIAQKWGGPAGQEGSTLSTDERTARLMTTWGFTQQDLDANRKGQFSEPQDQKVRKTQKAFEGYSAANPLIMLVVAGLVFVGVGGFMYSMLSRSNGLNISPAAIAVIGTVVVLIPIVIIISSRLSVKQMKENKNKADELLNVVGPAKYISGGGSRYGYWSGVEIGGVKFTNSVGNFLGGSDSPGEAKQWAFVEGASYRVFYTQMTMQGRSYSTLWSAEAV